ncbi:MAG: hypothetical protein K0Q90_4571, partial [Paenibacillaceae bacterium]|nr:hypothetical protein [Paenibacillaceae bacterium]
MHKFRWRLTLIFIMIIGCSMILA